MITRYLISLLLATLFVSLGVAQQLTVQDTKARLAQLGKTSHDDTLRVDLTMTMAMLYARISMDSARIAANEALRLSKRIGYTSGYARAVNGIANIDYAQGKVEKAAEGYAEALKIFEEIKSLTGQASCHTNLGLIASNLGKKEEAIDHYQKAIAIHKSKDSTSMDLSIAYLNLGELYVQDATTLSEAQTYLLKAVKLADKAGHIPLRIASYLGLGECFRLQGKSVEALGLGLKCLQLAREANDVHGVAQSYGYITRIYISKKEYGKALQYLDEAEATFEKIDDKNELSNIYVQKASVQTQLENYTGALETYKKLLPIVKKMERQEEIKNVYLGMAEAYRGMGDTSKADQYTQKAAEEMPK